MNKVGTYEVMDLKSQCKRVKEEVNSLDQQLKGPIIIGVDRKQYNKKVCSTNIKKKGENHQVDSNY